MLRSDLFAGMNMLGMPLWNWMLAILSSVGFFLATLCALKFTVTYLSARTNSKSARFHGTLIELLVVTNRLLMGLLSILIGICVLDLPGGWNVVATHLLFIAFALQVAFWLNRAVTIWKRDYLVKRSGTNIVMATLLSTFVHAAVWVIVVLGILENAGINITALVASLGVGGVAIALAAQTILGMAIAVTLGLALALLRRLPSKPLSWSAAAFAEFIRSTPLLVQIYFLFYVLPLSGYQLSPLTTGVLALRLHYAAYCSEVYRAGIESIPRTQWDAAAVLNLSEFRTLAGVILPQAIPPVVPALGNYLLAMFKDTPMLSVITVVELLQQSKIIGAEHFRYTEPLTLTGAMLLTLSLLSAALIRLAERRLRLPGRRR